MRRFASCGRARTSTPSTRTRPEDGRTSVLMHPIVVLLPAPLGPSRPKNSPLSTANETPRTASTGGDLRLPGYVFTRLSTTRMLMARESPYPLDPVPREHRVRRDDRDPLFESLGHEQAVERVAVVEREGGDPGAVPEVDGQGLEAVGGQLLGQEPVERAVDLQRAQADLDRDLPAAGDAHEALVAAASDRRPCPPGQLAVRPHPPEEGMGVEKQLHRT